MMKKYQCAWICGDGFDTLEELNTHRVRVHGLPSVREEPEMLEGESIVQPALNALSIDSLKDLQGKIGARISELECGKNFNLPPADPSPQSPSVSTWGFSEALRVPPLFPEAPLKSETVPTEEQEAVHALLTAELPIDMPTDADLKHGVKPESPSGQSADKFHELLREAQIKLAGQAYVPKEISEYQAEISTLRERVKELEAKLGWITCYWCGERYKYEAEKRRETVAEHLLHCPETPTLKAAVLDHELSSLRTRLEELVKRIEKFEISDRGLGYLSSYSLLRWCADSLRAAIKEPE